MLSHAVSANGPFDAAVRAVAGLDVVDMAFAASLSPCSRSFRLGHMTGVRSGSMDGLVTEVGQGLGGQVLVLDRPIAVADYASAPGITHQFDHAVAAEGLRAVFAVPLRVEGELRGAVYGAVRRPLDLGERFLRGVVEAVRASGRRRDAAAAEPLAPSRPDPRGRVVLEPDEARELRAALESARAAVDDPGARRRLDRLAARLREDDRATSGAGAAGRVTVRELDVLALVAVGCRNAEIAGQLSLSVETVKSYLKSAMPKLDSHTRAEAVHHARRAGLLS